ncbi:MAG: helix-turn-helix transcriptional regulator [Chitinophagaceae bacterium]
MVLDKSALIDQINFIIKKKLHKRHSELQESNHLSEVEVEEGDEGYSEQRRSWESTVQGKKIERRLKELEDQNDYLFSFIYFLFENMPMNNIDQLPVTPAVVPRKEVINNGQEEMCGENCVCEADAPCPTRREMEVLDLLNEGCCAKEIAQLLFISESTVITHKKNLKEKFKAKNTAELISKSYSMLVKK